ncbi:MAG TPA: hypothetical protein VJP02_06495 [Candidatus Sulfotelmatobacter sp.]|nr:hypothetical protein [Candidatus Sulfotelmatobacter sp.]
MAMAFGKPETDRLYDRAIAPTLDAVNLQAVRVDRVEHNGDIDDRIIQELKECRLAIADLTFTRPSVYFEAGYAQRVVPVIYTVRKDHFDRGAPDTARVHFDLQMRNIIDWCEPDDPRFKTRLAKRLSYVLRPILKEEREEAEYGLQKTQFLALSVNKQRSKMKEVLGEEFARARFKELDIPPNQYGYFTPMEQELEGVVRYGFKQRGSTLSLVEGIVSRGGVLKLLSQAAHYETQMQEKWFAANKGKRNLFYSRDIFVCALEKVPRQAVLRSFSNFIFDSGRECFIGEPIFGFRYTGRLKPLLRISIHVLDGVRSLEELRLNIRNRLAGIALQKV